MASQKRLRKHLFPIILTVSVGTANLVILSGLYPYLIGIILIMVILIMRYVRE